MGWSRCWQTVYSRNPRPYCQVFREEDVVPNRRDLTNLYTGEGSAACVYKSTTIMTKDVAIPDEGIISKIYLIRGQKAMLDRDLADLYDVTTGNLNKAVKRNLLRFPDDFMFQLNENEFRDLIFQNGTSSWGGTRKLPYAFTEQGVAMLSSVLNSERAVLMNIHIIRVFSRMREMLSTHKDVLVKLEQLERSVVRQDDDIKLIFDYLKKLLSPNTEPMRKIGFKHKKKD